MIRAYSILDMQGMKTMTRDGQEFGVIEGMATTPAPDRLGDIVEPKGASMSLPLPMLWQHRTDAPVGLWKSAEVSDAGIALAGEMPLFAESTALKERISEAWESVKLGLVRALSIGFDPKEWSLIKDTFSFHFMEWELLETSLVTIPANTEATIDTVKLFDAAQRGVVPRVALDSLEVKDTVVRLSSDIKRRAGLQDKGSVIK